MSKTVITYGTFDLFHSGHYKLLERAKKLGDCLIVGVTTENYDEGRGKLNVKQSLMDRIENIKATGLADKIIIEEYEGQKINDIQKYNVDIFAIGSDWLGKFDYLKEYCDVIYLERTMGVSSTEIRNESHGIIRVGVVGHGRIAKRFINEAKFVSGVDIVGVFGRNLESLKVFSEENHLSFFETSYEKFLDRVDAVYIATPHKTHYAYAMHALENGKHVLCEKPIALSLKEVEELIELSKSKGLIFLEAIKTAYAPGFQRMIAVAKSGLIGKIVNVDASFTKLYQNQNLREFLKEEGGGSLTELGSYPLLAIVKLLGTNVRSIHNFSFNNDEVDLFTKISLIYENAIATLKVGLGVKTEGDLVISGTKGYVYVPAPWWLTEYFEVRFEDSSRNKKYFYKFDGDGLRYELAEFINMINHGRHTHKLTHEDSIFIASIIDKYICE